MYPDPIEPTPDTRPSQAAALKQLRHAYQAALAGFDLRRSRELLLAAAGDGIGLGRMYADVVRPSLRTVAAADEAGGGSPTGRLVLGSVRATLAVLASAPADGAPRCGEGRTVLVSVGGEELDLLDGQVIMDVLALDGWTVEAFSPADDPVELAARSARRRVELVVMPTSRPTDLLRSVATYTQLRRLDDPPIIVACSFGHPDEARRARAAGADDFATDPDALLTVLDRRLPAAGHRAWGMKLRRVAETLIVTPTGDLDSAGVARLRAVVDSRLGTFDRLVLDAGKVGTAELHAVQELLDWMAAAAAVGRVHRLVAGEQVRPLLAGLDVQPQLLARPADLAV